MAVSRLCFSSSLIGDQNSFTSVVSLLHSFFLALSFRQRVFIFAKVYTPFLSVAFAVSFHTVVPSIIRSLNHTNH
ncbi:hypothetical protein HID58_054273 [Brassica napus]|uniref:Uncharacterized protein n=1 Tax=Brassica napus TaxID=3708 RepID=A0ABQ8AH33_BRANA|nr:hypothetical protein HID58_054273 [Brassica napus]